MLKAMVGLSFGLMFSTYSACSTIIVVWNPTSVFWAADSKVLKREIRTPCGNIPSDETKVCKSLVSSSSCCIVAGEGWVGDTKYRCAPHKPLIKMEGAWDFYEELRAGSAGAFTVDSVLQQLQGRLTSLLDRSGQDYDGPRCDDCIYFSVVSAGFDSLGRSVVSWLYFLAPANSKNSYDVLPERYVGGFGAKCFGQCSAVQPIIGDRLKASEFFSNGNLGADLEKLVRIQISATPATVGEPVSLTAISKRAGVQQQTCGVCKSSPCISKQ